MNEREYATHTLITLASELIVAFLSPEPGDSLAMLLAASEMRGVIWPMMFCTLKTVAFAGVSSAVCDTMMSKIHKELDARLTELSSNRGDRRGERVEDLDGSRARLSLSGDSRGGDAESEERKGGDLGEAEHHLDTGRRREVRKEGLSWRVQGNGRASESRSVAER